MALYDSILPSFQCNPGVGLKAFFDMVHVKPKKLVLFGAACSAVTDQIAKAAKHWNLVQVRGCVHSTYARFWPFLTHPPPLYAL